MTKALSILTPTQPSILRAQDFTGTLPEQYVRDLAAIQSRATWDVPERVWVRLHRLLQRAAMDLFMAAHAHGHGQSLLTSPSIARLQPGAVFGLCRTARDIPTTCLQRSRLLDRLWRDGCQHPIAHLGAPCCAVVDLLLEREWAAER